MSQTSLHIFIQSPRVSIEYIWTGLLKCYNKDHPYRKSYWINLKSTHKVNLNSKSVHFDSSITTNNLVKYPNGWQLRNMW